MLKTATVTELRTELADYLRSLKDGPLLVLSHSRPAAVLVEPEIPPNAGNVIRLAANTGARLHLVGPLGFSLDDRQLKRAGLDYHDLAEVRMHRSWDECREALAGRRIFARRPTSSRRPTTRS